MRALVQRVSEASVTVGGETVGEIGPGLCVFLGVKTSDTAREAGKLAEKVVNLRIFSDEQGKMNLSLRQIGGEMLIVSQFTLYANTNEGNRPSYLEAAAPELARELYEAFVSKCKTLCRSVATGIFQAQMEVRLVNNGPVTISVDTGN